jgi:hypothetical protein
MKNSGIIMGLILLALPGTARATDLTQDLTMLMQWMSGSFDNRRQVESGENRLREGPRGPEREPDLLYPIFSLVDAPAIGRHVVYLQWHQGRSDGPLQRQRIWTFDIDPERNAIVMDFFTLRDPDRWRDAHRNPESAVREMTANDLLPYPESCRLPFRRFIDVYIGEIPRGECRIVSQQTRTEMTIYARIVVSDEALWYDESGVRGDGSVVFRVPASGSYQFDRQEGND